MKKRLIEYDLPLADISEESAREKNIRHGHPSTLHIWWARRPLASSRATAFAALIDDLLDASRLQAGALALSRTEVSLDLLAKRMVGRFRPQSKVHTFEEKFPANFPVIQADESRLMQVLGNLLSNAVKYSPQGGKVLISGRTHPDKVIVCVQDEGPGIAMEDMPRIFNLFYRSNEASRKTKGAGLGLFLAKAVVEAHGGEIWVDDHVETGARICFSLPR